MDKWKITNIRTKETEGLLHSDLRSSSDLSHLWKETI